MKQNKFNKTFKHIALALAITLAVPSAFNPLMQPTQVYAGTPIEQPVTGDKGVIGDTGQKGNTVYDAEGTKYSDYNADDWGNHFASSPTYPPFNPNIKFQQVVDANTQEISNITSAGTYIALDEKSTKMVVINIDKAPQNINTARYGRVGYVITKEKVDLTNGDLFNISDRIVIDEKQSYYYLHLDSKNEFQQTTIPANSPITSNATYTKYFNYSEEISGSEILAGTSIADNLVDVPTGVFNSGSSRSDVDNDTLIFSSEDYESQAKSINIGGTIYSFNVMSIDYTHFRDYFNVSVNEDLTLYISPIYLVTTGGTMPNWELPTTRTAYINNLKKYYNLSTQFRSGDHDKLITKYSTMQTIDFSETAKKSIRNSYNIPIKIPTNNLAVTFIEVLDKEEGKYRKIFTMDNNSHIDDKINENFMVINDGVTTMGMGLYYTSQDRISHLPIDTSELNLEEDAKKEITNDTTFKILGTFLTSGGGPKDIVEFKDESKSLATILTEDKVKYNNLKNTLINTYKLKEPIGDINATDTISKLKGTWQVGPIANLQEKGCSIALNLNNTNSLPFSNNSQISTDTTVLDSVDKSFTNFDILTIDNVKGNCHLYVFLEMQSVAEPMYLFRYTDENGVTKETTVPTDYIKTCVEKSVTKSINLVNLTARSNTDEALYRPLTEIATQTKEFEGKTYSLANTYVKEVTLEEVPTGQFFTDIKNTDGTSLTWKKFNEEFFKNYTSAPTLTLNYSTGTPDENYGSKDSDGDFYPFTFNGSNATVKVYLFDYTASNVDVIYVNEDDNKVVQKDTIPKTGTFNISAPLGYELVTMSGDLHKVPLTFNIFNGSEFSSPGTNIRIIYPGNTLSSAEIADSLNKYLIAVSVKKKEPIVTDAKKIEAQYLAQMFNDDTINTPGKKIIYDVNHNMVKVTEFLNDHKASTSECGILTCTSLCTDDHCDDTCPEDCPGNHSHDDDCHTSHNSSCYCTTTTGCHSSATEVSKTISFNFDLEWSNILDSFGTTLITKNDNLILGEWTSLVKNTINFPNSSSMSGILGGPDNRKMEEFKWVSHRYSFDNFKGTLAKYKSDENSDAKDILSYFHDLPSMNEGLEPIASDYNVKSSELLNFNIHSANEKIGAWDYECECTEHKQSGDSHDNVIHAPKSKIGTKLEGTADTKTYNVTANATHIASSRPIASNISEDKQFNNSQYIKELYYNTKLEFYPTYEMYVEDIDHSNISVWLLGKEKRTLNATDKLKIEVINDASGNTPFELKSTWSREGNLSTGAYPNMKAGYTYQFKGLNNDSFRIKITSYNVLPKSTALGTATSNSYVDTTTRGEDYFNNAKIAHTNNVNLIKNKGLTYFTNLKDSTNLTIGALQTDSGYRPTVESKPYEILSLEQFDVDELSVFLTSEDFNNTKLTDQLEVVDWYEEKFDEFVVLKQETVLKYAITTDKQSNIFINNLKNASSTKNNTIVLFDTFETIMGNTKIAGTCVGVKLFNNTLFTTTGNSQSLTFNLCSNPKYFYVVDTMYDDRH